MDSVCRKPHGLRPSDGDCAVRLFLPLYPLDGGAREVPSKYGVVQFAVARFALSIISTCKKKTYVLYLSLSGKHKKTSPIIQTVLRAPLNRTGLQIHTHSRNAMLTLLLHILKLQVKCFQAILQNVSKEKIKYNIFWIISSVG